MHIVDRPKLPLEPIVWDSVPRGNSATMPFRLTKQNRHSGLVIPYNLTGAILMLTVKSDLYDGTTTDKHKTDKIEDVVAYNKMLRDDTSVEGLGDFVFRVTIDCDDMTTGEIAPLWVTSKDWGAKEVFHGMYGEDARNGEVVFRIPKQMTFVDPGTYNFDIRIMFKQERRIGAIQENPAYLLCQGTFDIYGTPNNRSTTVGFMNF